MVLNFFFKSFPSMLTISRIVVMPFLIRYVAYQEYWIASILFIYAGISDYLDGFFARKWCVTSQCGAMLDIVADKCVMLGACIGLLLYVPAISMRWFLYMVLIREFNMIIGSWVWLLTHSKVYIESLYIGKISMTLQFVLIAYMFISLALQIPISGIGTVIFILGLCTIIISLIFYAIHFYRITIGIMQRNI